ncbi:hypothetical protein GSI_12317 [Ganoderma sinense ZZ0214-1]|uniref:BTB domain-containing protein n=1 Tax=Ganoderma sinense ZZ0214-1 TaxID=1077348 RepID=A0A2G8RYF6_9APHY|nr:hypothetical protein GSI_12317 [Ganoderma sinense ZZ0214-1]
MSDGPPPEKRARFSENASLRPHASLPQLLAAFKRDDEFWLEDGNLILVANQSTVFRIYCALLTAQSAVFADSISSASSDPAQMCDGCPVVEVSDTPEELAHFLRVVLPKSQQVYAIRYLCLAASSAQLTLIYKLSRFYRRDGEPQFTFDQASAVIRLAHKYRVDDVKAQGMRLLHEMHFTSDWTRWEMRSELKPALAVHGSYAIGAVNLARQIGATSLLPIAFYECTRLGGAVLDGWRRDDGVVEHLTAEDLLLCMKGRDALVREVAALFVKVFARTPCDECTSPKCRSRLRLVRRDVFLEGFPGHLVFDREQWMPDLERDYRICEFCSEEVRERCYQECDRIWAELSEIFGINVKEWP